MNKVKKPEKKPKPEDISTYWRDGYNQACDEWEAYIQAKKEEVSKGLPEEIIENYKLKVGGKVNDSYATSYYNEAIRQCKAVIAKDYMRRDELLTEDEIKCIVEQKFDILAKAILDEGFIRLEDVEIDEDKINKIIRREEGCDFINEDYTRGRTKTIDLANAIAKARPFKVRENKKS